MQEHRQRKQFVIDEALLQRVINYLVSKPYIEVHELITACLRLKPQEGENEEAEGND